MKTNILELKSLDLVELSEKEKQNIDGGFFFLGTLLVAALGFGWGFICGALTTAEK